MIIPIILTPITAGVSGILYRLGGASREDSRKEFPWVPEWFRNMPKKRDAGCGIMAGLTAWAWLGGTPWWAWFFSAGVLWGALSTYWDWMFNDTDNYYMHGFMCGLAYFLYAIASGMWVGFGVRCIALAILMGLWSHTICKVFKGKSRAVAEEVGRGALIILTLPLMLI